MDAQGNKLSSCKIPDRYLKKTKNLLNFSGIFGFKEKKRKENSEYNRVFITTPKIAVEVF